MPKAQSILDRKGTDVDTIDKESTVLQAAERMSQRHIGAMVVVSGEHVVGIFTERDVLNRVVAERKNAETTKVGDVMTSPMFCCRRDTPLLECRSIMTSKRIRHLPVVEEGRLFGIISSGDILATEVAEKQTTIEYLHNYLYGRS